MVGGLGKKLGQFRYQRRFGSRRKRQRALSLKRLAHREPLSARVPWFKNRSAACCTSLRGRSRAPMARFAWYSHHLP